MPVRKTYSGVGGGASLRGQKPLSDVRRPLERPDLIAVADLHLTLRRPPARAEQNWLDVQADRLAWLSELKAKYNCPIVYAGDIFDRYDAGAKEEKGKHDTATELINWAIHHVPKGYAVPGNHDLPNHDLSQVHRSAYWILVEAGVLEDLPVGIPIRVDDSLPSRRHLFLTGFPCGTKEHEYGVRVLVEESGFHVAVVHGYCWEDQFGHPGAKEEDKSYQWANRLSGYDVAVFGDNHQSFVTRYMALPTVVNVGCFIPRRSDERTLGTKVALIYVNDHDRIELVHPDELQDHWLDRDTKEWKGLQAAGVDPTEAIQEFRRLADACIDFQAAVEQVVQKMPFAARELALEILTKANRK